MPNEANLKKFINRELAVNCKEKNQAFEFIKWFRENVSPNTFSLDETNYDKYQEQTCYSSFGYFIYFGKLDDYIENGFEIIDFEEFFNN